MAELQLPQEETLRLRAEAHRLDPVVRMGAAGLSAAVLAEIDRALRAHGLIKVRSARAERPELATEYAEIADRLGAARVQMIGHTFVLFRPVPEKEAVPARKPRAAVPARRVPAARKAPQRRSNARPPQR